MDKNSQNPMVGTVPVNQVGSDVMGAGVTNGVVGGPSSAAPSQAISTFSTIKKRYGRRGGRTTNNGDIILNVPHQKSSRSLIIGGVVLIIAIIIPVTIFILPKTTGQDISHSQINRYFNYIISGTEEDNAPKINQSLRDTKAYTCYMGGENCENYFGRAQEILKNTVSTYADEESSMKNPAETSEENNDEGIKNNLNLSELFSNHKNQLDTIELFLAADFYNSDLMFAYLLSETSTDVAVKAIKDNYAKLASSENPSANRYAEIQGAVADNSVHIVNIFRDKKCFKGGIITKNCLKPDAQAEVDELVAKNREHDAQAASFMNGLIESYYNTARNIYNQITNQGSNE